MWLPQQHQRDNALQIRALSHTLLKQRQMVSLLNKTREIKFKHETN